MRVPRTRKKLVGVLFCVPAAVVALVVLSGCGGDSYPEDLAYPPRTDPIVLDLPKQSPLQLDGPGQWHDLRLLLVEQNGKLLDPTSLPGRETVQAMLEELFGRPAQPTVDVGKASEDGKLTWKKLNAQILDDVQERYKKQKASAEDAEDKAEVAELEAEVSLLEKMGDDPLKLNAETLAEGSRLYRRHCLHCHGLSGDGHGPTGPWVNPHPRDYRKGFFKFTSTSASGWNPLLGLGGQKLGTARRPQRGDLIRTMQHGIDGSSMPAFGQLPEAELEKIASYVIHLSLRGEVELDILTALGERKDKGLADNAIRKQMRETLRVALANWISSQACPVLVKYPFDDANRAALQESIKLGYRLFAGKGQTWQEPSPSDRTKMVAKAGGLCIECHADYGRQFNYKWDDWGNVVRPADLTAGIYHGGRRPVDLYYRLASGINGTPMPTVLSNQITATDVWHLVHFVQALPYPAMLPEDVRKDIYPDYQK